MRLNIEKSEIVVNRVYFILKAHSCIKTGTTLITFNFEWLMPLSIIIIISIDQISG